MAKQSTTTTAPAGTSAAGAAPSAAQGAGSVPAVTAPGAAAAAQRTPLKRVTEDPSVSTSLPVQADDGTDSMLAWALNQAGVDGLEEDPHPTPNKRKPAKDPADDEPVVPNPAANPAQAKDGSPANDEDDEAFDPDAPVLVDEDEDPLLETGDEEDDADGKLKKDNFKLREKRRELEAALQAEKAEREKLQAQLEKVATTANAAPQFGGYFAGVKTPADVDQAEEQIQAHLDYFEDHPDGYEFTDDKGNEIVVTADMVRAYRRQALQQQRQAAKVRELLKEHVQRTADAETLARKKYPFVFDAKQSLNNDVLELAAEFPSLARDPRRALVLGRMAIARLVESGKYALVKRGAKPAAAAEPSSSSSSPAAPRQTPSRQAGRPAAKGQEPSLADRFTVGDRTAMEEAAMALFQG
jgi:hypothetical protein